MTKSRGLKPRLNPPTPITLEWLREQCIVTETGCWEWGHSRITAGYGNLRHQKRYLYTHRLACALAHGEPPKGAHALHSCDNPPCCNPEHLRWGTHGENMREAQERGRIVQRTNYRGLRHHSSKLSWDIAQQIRARHAGGETQVALAGELGLHFSSVWAIVHWKTWTTPEGTRP